MVETTIPATTPASLVAVFGLCVAVVVACMLLTVVLTTLLLNAVFNFRHDVSCRTAQERGKLRPRVFEEFWDKRYAADYIMAVNTFEYGIVFFLLLLILVGWIQFTVAPAASWT